MTAAPDTLLAAKMEPVGWDALAQWGDDAVRVERLAGGVANNVWSVRVDGHLAVGRLGTRRAADMTWETNLLAHLDREGLTPPVPTTSRPVGSPKSDRSEPRRCSSHRFDDW